MTSSPTSILQTVADMQRQFDGAFAMAHEERAEDRELIIVIRVAGELFAVRTAQITGVTRLRRIAPLPTSVPAFLGITSVRGHLFPAYDTAALLGLPARESEKGWMIFANCDPPIGLVFEGIDAQMEVACACIYENQTSNSRDYLRRIVKFGKTNRAVIDIPGLVEEIRRQARASEIQRSNQ